MNYSASDIKNLGTILGVWAHPDDESWSMGGVMAVAAANGQRVVCITATRGDAGQTADPVRWPQADLGKIREQELHKAMKVLGVKEHLWLDYKDGHLKDSPAGAALQAITQAINRIQPDTVISFGPDGITGHDDHRTVYEWTKLALAHSGSPARFFRTVETTEKYNAPITKKCDEMFDIYFNIDTPETVAIQNVDFYFTLPEDILAQKIESLRVQECQTAGMFADPLGLEYIHTAAAAEAFMLVE